MCCLKFIWTILLFAVICTAVKGSCLEYGHSCWGAHGKRSGGTTGIKQLPHHESNQLRQGSMGKQQNDNLSELFIDPSNDDEDDNDNLSATGSDLAKLALLWQQQHQQQQQQQHQKQQNKHKSEDRSTVEESWQRQQLFTDNNNNNNNIINNNEGDVGSVDLSVPRVAFHKALLQRQWLQRHRQQQQSDPATLNDLYESTK